MNRITEIADELISLGLTGVYNMTYEAIEASTVMWEYKGLDGNIYGPFTSQQISEWKTQGFLTGPTAVMLRKIKPVAKSSGVSIYDDEDDQPAKKAKVDEPKAPAIDGAFLVSSLTLFSNALLLGEWINSDDVDFGTFINLNDLEFNQEQSDNNNSKIR
jgi:hypothetical protein